MEVENWKFIGMPPTEAAHDVKFFLEAQILCHESSHNTLETFGPTDWHTVDTSELDRGIKLKNWKFIGNPPVEAGHDMKSVFRDLPFHFMTPLTNKHHWSQMIV